MGLKVLFLSIENLNFRPVKLRFIILELTMLELTIYHSYDSSINDQ